MNAIITYQFLLKECVEKVVNKSGDENYSRDNLSLERTRSNTSKILGRIRTQRFCGNRDQICKCEISTQFHHRVAIGRTRNYKDEQYSKESLTIRTTFLVLKFAKKSHNANNCELHKTTHCRRLHDIPRNTTGSVQVYTRSQTIDSKIHIKALSRIRRRACLGKPRSIHSYI